MCPRSTSPSRNRMATLRVGVSGSWGSERGISTHFTADSGTQAVSLFSMPPTSSTSTRKSGSSKSSSRASPAMVSSSKKRMFTSAIELSLHLNGASRPQLARTGDTGRQVLPHTVRLGRPQLAREIGREQRDDLGAGQLGAALHGHELLLESQARPVQE